MDIADLLLSRPIETTYVAGPLDGATRDMPLDVVQAGLSAEAAEIVYRNPQTNEPIDPSPYRLRLAPSHRSIDDEGIPLEPEEERKTRPIWAYAGPIENVL